MTSALTATMPTLLDWVKRADPNGGVARIVEQLAKRSPLIEDMPSMEGNLDTGHMFTSRTGLPSVTWRMINQGVDPSKSTTTQHQETCGMLEGLSVIDTELARINGNGAAFRASEDAAFLQSMKNDVEAGVFTHSTSTTPEKFMGLAGRMNSTTAAQGGGQIVLADSGASGSDQASIYGICWGPNSVYSIFPKGMSGGLTIEDKGEQMVLDANSKRYWAYVTKMVWRIGLVVEDYRQVVRVANVDTSALTADASAGADLIESLISAYYKLYDPMAGRLVWYCNRTVATYLHKQARNGVAASTLSIENIAGKPITSLLGAPVRVTDGLGIDEAAIS